MKRICCGLGVLLLALCVLGAFMLGRSGERPNPACIKLSYRTETDARLFSRGGEDASCGLYLIRSWQAWCDLRQQAALRSANVRPDAETVLQRAELLPGDGDSPFAEMDVRALTAGFEADGITEDFFQTWQLVAVDFFPCVGSLRAQFRLDSLRERGNTAELCISYDLDPASVGCSYGAVWLVPVQRTCEDVAVRWSSESGGTAGHCEGAKQWPEHSLGFADNETLCCIKLCYRTASDHPAAAADGTEQRTARVITSLTEWTQLLQKMNDRAAQREDGWLDFYPPQVFGGEAAAFSADAKQAWRYGKKLALPLLDEAFFARWNLAVADDRMEPGQLGGLYRLDAVTEQNGAAQLVISRDAYAAWEQEYTSGALFLVPVSKSCGTVTAQYREGAWYENEPTENAEGDNP